MRNLAYMVSRREKLSRSFLKLREQILEKQLVLLADDDPTNQVRVQPHSPLLIGQSVLRVIIKVQLSILDP